MGGYRVPAGEDGHGGRDHWRPHLDSAERSLPHEKSQEFRAVRNVRHTPPYGIQPRVSFGLRSWHQDASIGGRRRAAPGRRAAQGARGRRFRRRCRAHRHRRHLDGARKPVRRDHSRCHAARRQRLSGVPHLARRRQLDTNSDADREGRCWDEVEGLDTGADDYLIKPFSYAVLIARLRALRRRGTQARPTVLEAGGLRLDPATRRVWLRGEQIELTPREFAILEYLLHRPDAVLSKRDILDHVWDFDFDGDPKIVEVYVRRLRTKLHRPGDRVVIETVRGAGYRLVAARD